jgi:threonine dehydratase
VIPLDRIRAAARRLAGRLRPTPLLPLGDGSARLKLECLQPTGSFKVRGFLAAASALSEAELRRGLITVSAGNAALACAHTALACGVGCRVFMFETAPAPKVEGVRRLGAEPVLMPRPQLLDWMAARAWEAEPETFIHPFADEEVMAGHGSLGLELLEQLPDLARVLVPVGGGGLITGVASALKGSRPEVEVIGVQSEGYPLWPRALEAGGSVTLSPATIADGTTAPFDASMFERLQEVVDRWILVPEPEVRTGVARLAKAAKVVTEGSGALGFAALEGLPAGGPTAVVISGGNIDRHLLAELLSENL